MFIKIEQNRTNQNHKALVLKYFYRLFSLVKSTLPVTEVLNMKERNSIVIGRSWVKQNNVKSCWFASHKFSESHWFLSSEENGKVGIP